MYVERIRIPNSYSVSASLAQKKERGASTERGITLEGDNKRDKNPAEEQAEKNKKETQDSAPSEDAATLATLASATGGENPSLDLIA